MRRWVCLLSALSLAATPAWAEVLAEWTFETSVPITAGPHAAEGGVYGGAATGFHADSAAVYSNPVGNGSPESFSSNTWGAGDYYQFETSTSGYQGITIQWDQTRSSTGPGSFDLEYSTDGVSYSTLVDDYTIDAITWSSVTYNALSTFGPVAGPAGLDDQATVLFRLTAQAPGSSAAGSNRVDDIIISGTLIPEPASLALLSLGALAAARRRS